MSPENRRWDAVIFDVDGTLIDSVPFIVESFQYTFTRHLGHPLDEENIKAGIGRPLEAVFGEWPPEMASQLMASYMDYNMAHLLDRIPVFPGVHQMLESLGQSGYPTAIVTSKRLAALKPTLQKAGIFDRFDLIITKEDTTLHKPHPEPLLTAMERMGLQAPGRVLYVGDSIHDLECAVSAGCQPVMVEWTRMPKDSLRQAHPAIWIDQPDDLITLLEN